ncbi:MAG TPA: ferredoxin [Nocardioides sp.]|nr:ferredoxin [Nocardioides sp.]
MRFIVDLRACQDHGHCAFTSSAFPLDKRGKLDLRQGGLKEYRSDVLPVSMRDELEEAMFACPAQAIELVDDDA